MVAEVHHLVVRPARRQPSVQACAQPGGRPELMAGDRKSTRLNSSHGYISYAVFCLKKKKKQLQLYVPVLELVVTHPYRSTCLGWSRFVSPQQHQRRRHPLNPPTTLQNTLLSTMRCA